MTQGERECKSEIKNVEGNLMTGPQTLSVGDFAVKDMGSMSGKNAEILWYPKDKVCEMPRIILHSLEVWKNNMLHTDVTDDFTDLFKPLADCWY